MHLLLPFPLQPPLATDQANFAFLSGQAPAPVILPPQFYLTAQAILLQAAKLSFSTADACTRFWLHQKCNAFNFIWMVFP